MPTPRKLEDYIQEKKWEKLFAGLDEQMDKLSKRALELKSAPAYLEYAVEDVGSLRLKKMPHSFLKWHFTNSPGPRGEWDVMTSVMEGEDGTSYLVKDFARGADGKLQEPSTHSESPAKLVYQNMKDLQNSLIRAGNQEYMSPVPRVKLATLVETREDESFQPDLTGEMGNFTHLERAIPTLEHDRDQLVLEFVGEGMLVKNILEDQGWSRTEREEMILTIIDQMLDLDTAMDPGKIKRFSNGSISYTNDVYYAKINPPGNPSLRAELDELYPRKGRLILMNWEDMEDVEKKRTLEMTRSFVSALKKFISGKHPNNTISTLDFADNASWGKSDISLATRFVISEIINRKDMTVEEAKLLINESRDLINLPTQDLRTKQQQLTAIVLEQDRGIQTALTSSQRSQQLRLNVDPGIFKLTTRALVCNDLLARAINPDSAEYTSLTDLVTTIKSMNRERLFRHLKHALDVSTCPLGLAIIDELLPRAVEEKSFILARHLMRTRKLFTFIDQTSDLDLPLSIRTRINQFVKDNLVDLNLDWLKVHTEDLEKLFVEIDEFSMQNGIPDDARNSIKDFMAEMKYSMATIQADEIRTTVDIKAGKFAEAKQYLSSIGDQEYLDLIYKTAPDLDRAIEHLSN